MSEAPTILGPCEAGRTLVRDGDSFWSLPCSLPGVEILVVQAEHEDEETLYLPFCLEHWLQLPGEVRNLDG